MRAGELKHRITIQYQIKSKNAMGEWTSTWSDFISCWAAIEPASGTTYYAAKQAESSTDGRVRIRYRSGIKPTMRIIHGERALNIVSIIQPKENHRELHLMYTEAKD